MKAFTFIGLLFFTERATADNVNRLSGQPSITGRRCDLPNELVSPLQ